MPALNGEMKFLMMDDSRRLAVPKLPTSGSGPSPPNPLGLLNRRGRNESLKRDLVN